MKRGVLAGVVVAAVAVTAVVLFAMRPQAVRSTDATVDRAYIEAALGRIDEGIWGMTPPLDAIALFYKPPATSPAPANPSLLLTVAKGVDLRELAKLLDALWPKAELPSEGWTEVQREEVRRICRVEAARFDTVVAELERWQPDRQGAGALRDDLIAAMRQYMRAYDALGAPFGD